VARRHPTDALSGKADDSGAPDRFDGVDPRA